MLTLKKLTLSNLKNDFDNNLLIKKFEVFLFSFNFIQ